MNGTRYLRASRMPAQAANGCTVLPITTSGRRNPRVMPGIRVMRAKITIPTKRRAVEVP